MKKLLVLSLLVLLNGCAIVDIYRMARFDNNEYLLANNIRTTASIGVEKCGSPEVVPVVDSLWSKSLELKNYSASIPHNEEAAKMTAELADIVKGLSEKYDSLEPVSPSYCNLKFKSIEKNATTIQTAIGAKPR